MVSNQIRILRKKNNWSQTELANKLGISRSSVKAWELGASMPSTAVIIKLTNIFQASADFLLETNYNADYINLEQLNEAEKVAIRKLINVFLRNGE